MELRFVGASGVRVSALALGTMGFGVTGSPVGSIDLAGAKEQVALALDAGINLFDTADTYQGGHAEQLLGRALGRRRVPSGRTGRVRLPGQCRGWVSGHRSRSITKAAQAEVGAVVSRMISSDSHLIEHPTLWEERMPDQYRERGPRVVRNDEGMDWWYVDGKRTMSFLGIQAGRRFDGDPTKLVTQSTFEDVRPGAYDPKLFVKEAEEDGIVGSVLYPTEGLVLFSVPDSGLCSATMRAYNDYIAEFCGEDPHHLKGIGMINVDDPAEGAAEVARCREIGLVGALMTVLPPAWQMYDDRAYDVLWAAAQDLQMPLSLHTATNRADPKSGAGGVPDNVQQVSPSLFVLQDSMVRRSLADMIFSGVFERYPRLRVGTVEHELAWIPHFLHQLDYTYTDRPPRGDWHRYKDPAAIPSDFFHSNVFCSFQEDAIGIRERDLIGVETLMWGSDYPHTESTFPRSREITSKILQGVPEAEQEMILYSNAKQLYGFDV